MHPLSLRERWENKANCLVTFKLVKSIKIFTEHCYIKGHMLLDYLCFFFFKPPLLIKATMLRGTVQFRLMMWLPQDHVHRATGLLCQTELLRGTSNKRLT